MVYCYRSNIKCIYIFTAILIYCHFLQFYELECKILVNIPATILDSPLRLPGKKGDIVRKKDDLNMLSNLVKNKLKHAKDRIKFLSY